MDLINIIEKSIEFNVRLNAMEDSTRNRSIDAFLPEASSGVSRKDELDNVHYILQMLSRAYSESLATADADSIKEVSTALKAKKADVERNIDLLQYRRKWAMKKTNAVSNEYDLESTMIYTRLALDSCMEVDRITPSLFYYDRYIEDLDKHYNNKKGKRSYSLSSNNQNK